MIVTLLHSVFVFFLRFTVFFMYLCMYVRRWVLFGSIVLNILCLSCVCDEQIMLMPVTHELHVLSRRKKSASRQRSEQGRKLWDRRPMKKKRFESYVLCVCGSENCRVWICVIYTDTVWLWSITVNNSQKLHGPGTVAQGLISYSITNRVT